jgi:hypothetical protein
MGNLLNTIKNIGQAVTGTLESAASGGSSELDPASYVSIIQDMSRFRAGAFNEGQMYDMPGQVFFRILFHFYNNSDDLVPQPGTGDTLSTGSTQGTLTGLLAPVWINLGDTLTTEVAKNKLEELWNHNTAFSYLMINNEIERAKNLKRFVELLSNINSQSPWYFQSVKGLDTAVERQIVTGDFQLKEERDKITIECLDDSYDQRIGTLLDLYRSVVWSWETKREVVPRNLRKFDMTVIEFQLPLRGLHVSRKSNPMTDSERRATSKKSEGSLSVLAGPGGLTVFNAQDGTSAPVASYKAFEFHGCEIDYNSSRSGVAELSNEQGTVPKYSIDINYDDMYEIRFNEFMGAYASDLMGDTSPVAIVGDESTPKYLAKESSSKETNESEQIADSPSNELPSVKTATYTEPGTTWVDQLIGAGKSIISSKLNSIYLGNLNGISISRIEQQAGNLKDLWGTVGAIKSYTSKSSGGIGKADGNIFTDSAQLDVTHIKRLGNIFKSNTVLNS